MSERKNNFSRNYTPKNDNQQTDTLKNRYSKLWYYFSILLSAIQLTVILLNFEVLTNALLIVIHLSVILLNVVLSFEEDMSRIKEVGGNERKLEE